VHHRNPAAPGSRPLERDSGTGIVDVTEYGVRGKRGDFEPLISEDLFHRVQAILSGRLPSTTPQQRADPDFPLRGFVPAILRTRSHRGWSEGPQRPIVRSVASRRLGPSRISSSARSGRPAAHRKTRRRREAATVGGRLYVGSAPCCGQPVSLLHRMSGRHRTVDSDLHFSERRQNVCLQPWTNAEGNHRAPADDR
jgi:hypothetical protein